MLESVWINPIIYIFILTTIKELTTSNSTWKHLPCSLMVASPARLMMRKTSSLPCSHLKHKTAPKNWKDTWPFQQITWTHWSPFQLCASCLWSWTHLYLPQQPVKGYLASQDLSSAQEERDCILAIFKTNSFWSWTESFSVSSNDWIATLSAVALQPCSSLLVG